MSGTRPFGARPLEAFLVNPLNRYSAALLHRYTEEGWGALPVWNPRVRRVRPSDIGELPPKPDFTWQPLDISGEWDQETLIDLGARSFTTFPTQLEPSMLALLAEPDGPRRGTASGRPKSRSAAWSGSSCPTASRRPGRPKGRDGPE